MREGEQRDAWSSGEWGNGSGGLPTKTPPPHSLSNLLGPQFSLSVGGDCSEGWSDNSVSQTWGARVWEKSWDLDHSSMCEKG